MKFSSVVSLHTNPLTCGVAKFGSQLAEKLGVPFIGVDIAPLGDAPLFSLKWSEMKSERGIRMPDGFSVFWHDAGHPSVTDKAKHVFFADPSLGSPALFCPSLIQPKQRTVRLFTFGMAGRLQVEQYAKVKALLDAASICYHLRVSVGIHEGTSLDRVEKHFDDLKTLMGAENVTILGILSDEAVSDELANADYTLAFFQNGARANNTTIHAAIEAGSGVITNWDAGTPLFFHHATKNIDHLRTWPKRPGCHLTPYTWDELLRQMKDLCDRSPSTAAR